MESLRHKYCILDGGLATELTLTHKQAINGDPLWSARLLHTNPDLIKQVHMSFLQAGADLVETATYQASVDGFMTHLNVGRVEAENLIRKAVSICQEARDSFWQTADVSNGRMKPLVVGSIGPYGAHLADGSEYHGRYVDSLSVEELADWHRPLASLLLESGVDILAFETIPASKEAEAVVHLLREFPACRALVSFSCKDENVTCHGDDISAAVRAVQDCEQVLAVGINCTRPTHISSLLSQIPKDVGDRKAVAVYPNGGEDWIYSESEGNFHWPSTKSSSRCLAEYVDEWIGLGAKWIGGCCGVYPKDIAQIRANVEKFMSLKTPS